MGFTAHYLLFFLAIVFLIFGLFLSATVLVKDSDDLTEEDEKNIERSQLLLILAIATALFASFVSLGYFAGGVKTKAQNMGIRF